MSISARTDAGKSNAPQHAHQYQDAAGEWRKLWPHHIEHLAQSGITLEFAQAAGIYTEDREAPIQLMLRSKALWKKNGQFLVFPFSEGFCRVRPDHPRTVKDKPAKYESPKEGGLRAYFPPGVRQLLESPTQEIIFTEGEKKSLAATQFGFPTIGLTGVSCYSPKGRAALLPELEAIAWKGRRVFIAYDSDLDRKPDVARAEASLARRLAKTYGADVRCVRIPDGPLDANNEPTKWGLDDFLVAQAEPQRALRKLLDDAIEPPTIDNEKLFPPASIFHEQQRTEIANARRLVAVHGADIRYISAWKQWLVWDGARWQPDATCGVQAKAKDIADKLWDEAHLVRQHLDRDEDKGIIAAVMGFARSSSYANSVAHSIDLAGSEPGIATTHEALDTAPMLLNVVNGTIDLATGKIRPHDRADHITKQAPVVFDAEAECPQWRKFLQDVFPDDDELIAYVRRLVGYCLTGCTRDHVLPFLHGAGANGKSVFTTTIMGLLGGDYSMRAAPELLMAKGNDSHPTERADLFGKRLVISNEVEAGRRLNESLVKDLTGGDAIRARRMREDFWQFQPTHKVWLVGNHKPGIRGTDNGIWRRVKLIPFERIFAEHEQDKDLPAKLQRELSGIFNWALLGCIEWQHEGLGEPEAVRRATADYRQEQDIVAAFIDDRCLTAPDTKAKAGDLYQAYKAWSEACGEKPIGSRRFGEEMAKRFERRQSNGLWYVGLGVLG